jgi:RimJ/RimL family protein N-acetyltransferase
MHTDLFTGEKVYLAALEPEKAAELSNRWAGDSDYLRLADSDPAYQYSVAEAATWIEKHLNDKNSFNFTIFIRQDKRPIGDLGLAGIDWVHRNAYLGIAIGEREEWGKGYGSDAVKIILRFAFTELNLHRVSLTVFDYNERAIRSYEKAGFRLEGRQRGFLKREGQRWDLIYMGILRREWEESQMDSQAAIQTEMGETT